VTIEEWLRPVIHYKVSDSTIQVRAGDIHADWLLLPLDTPQNIQRLLSLELTYAWCSEMRELPLEIVQTVFSRTGRFPSKVNGGATWRGLWGETNSFSEDSEYNNFLEVDRPKNVAYFIQPGGMESDAENVENLPDTYYQDMVEANSPDWIDQYIHNQIGPSLSGQAVFAKSFDYEFHTRDALTPDFNRALIVGVDTGRHPAAVVGQIDSRGRMLVLCSVAAENMGMEKFVAEKLRPLLTDRFQGAGKYFLVMDPAGRQKSQIGEESVFDSVKRLGFSAVLAPTNDIEPRLRAVEKYLQMQISAGGGMLIDRAWNQGLIRAIMHGYRYKRSKDGVLGEKPEKLHPESDLCDGLQYLCLSADSGVIARSMRSPRERKPPPAAAGWT